MWRPVPRLRRHQGQEEVRAAPDHVYADRSEVEAGKKLRVRGDDCPDGAPAATLDGAPLALNVASKSKGFTAEATIPPGTAPGKHKFYAGCDAGSSGPPS